jgi:voltage-gated potassium channel
MFTALRSMLRDPEGKILLAWASAQILIGTLAYMWLEDWSAVDALYFSVVTLATVGFGDLSPTTTAAKLFTVVYILLGLGVIAAFISEITKHRAAAISRLRARAGTPEPDAESGSPGATSTTTDDDAET